MSFEVKQDRGIEIPRARVWPLVFLFAFAVSAAWSLEPVIGRILAP